MAEATQETKSSDIGAAYITNRLRGPTDRANMATDVLLMLLMLLMLMLLLLLLMVSCVFVFLV